MASGPFLTLTAVHDLAGRRFATVELGTVKAETVRAEHTALAQVAAAVCGVEMEQLTREMVEAVDLKALRAALHGVPAQ